MRKFFYKHGKKLVAAMMALVFLLSFASAAYATDQLYDKYKPKEGIAEEIHKENSSDQKQILEDIDRQVANIVGTVRVIAAIFAVIFVIWIGIVFLTSGGNPQRLMQVKTQIALFFVSLICIFMAEGIVRFFLSWVTPK